MAEFVIECPHCGEATTVDTDWAGMEVDCPSCSNPFIVPGTEENTEEPAQDLPPSPPPQEQPGLPPNLPPGFDPSIFDYKPPQKPLTKSIVGAGLTLGSFLFYFAFPFLYVNLFAVVLALAGMFVSFGVIETLKDKKGLSKESIRNTKICSWCALLLALVVPVVCVARANHANNTIPKEEKSFEVFIYAAMGLEPENQEGTTGMQAAPSIPLPSAEAPGVPVNTPVPAPATPEQ